MFDAVIFDCDGCLIDSEVLALEVELEALAAVGMVYDRDEFCRRFMGLPNDAFFAALDEDRRARLGEPLPVDFRPLHVVALTRAVDERLTEVAGAAAAVAMLSRPKAVASSSHSTFLERKLKRVGLWDAFAPHVYSGDMVARGKPEPDIFLHAAAGLDVAAERCLVIEDSVNGVAAAPFIIVTMFVSSNRTIMGEYVNGRAAKILGWLTATLMAVAAIALFATGGV